MNRARVASGSNREESNRHGTSVRVVPICCTAYKDDVKTQYPSVLIAFDVSIFSADQQDLSLLPLCSMQIIQSIVSDLGRYLNKRKADLAEIELGLTEVILNTDYLGENIAEYNTQSVDYTIFLQSQYISLPRLKHYLDNLIHIGNELGVYGLFRAGTMLRNLLHASEALNFIVDPTSKELFDSSLQRIDCLVDDILRNLVDLNENKTEVLFSSKVLTLFERLANDIDRGSLGRCIVFVERIYTAAILSLTLNYLKGTLPSESQKRLRIKYVTGQRSNMGDATMNAKYQVRIIFCLLCLSIDRLV